MATIKANGQTYFIDTVKITTPSIKINNGIFVGVSNGSSQYVPGYIPLFSGNKGGTVDYNRYRYTLGGLKVGNLRAAVSRSFINHAPSVSISASSTRVANGTKVTITAYASDPDGDPVSYEWEGVSSTGYYVNVSGSNQTKSYRCRVRDAWGAYSSWSNQVSITWYNPNNAPYVGITSYSTSVEAGNDISVTFNYYDVDGDAVTVDYGWYGQGSGGVFYYHATGSFSDGGVRTAKSATVTIPTSGATAYNGAYRIYVRITDSKGATDIAKRDVTQIIYNYRATVKVYYESKAGAYGGYSSYFAKVTALKIPSTYNTFCLAYGDDWYYETAASSSGFSSVTIYPINATTTASNTYDWYGNISSTTYKTKVHAVGPSKTIAVSNKGTWTAQW